MKDKFSTKNKLLIKILRKTAKSSSGITLVALAVTIVVLIILSTVSIQAIFSDNGLLGQAGKVKEIQSNVITSEEKSTNKLIEEYDAMTTNPPKPDNRPLVTTLTTKQEKTVIAKDRLGNQVVVPGGFKVVAGETVQDGIVIEDDNITSYEDGTTSTGTQFVWIPVSNIDLSGNNKIIIENTDETTSEVEITLGRYTFAGDNGEPTLVQSGAEYNAENTDDKYTIDSLFTEKTEFQESIQLGDLTGTNATAKDLEKFIESVRKNQGYYIARYEASYESGSEFGVGINIAYYKPASKTSIAKSRSSMNYNSGTLWNYITQGNASIASRQMYYGDSFVDSDLMNSYAWDTAIVYIQAMGNNNYANASDKNGTLYNAGDTTINDLKCNIYDMGTNLSEWTTEYCNYTDSYNVPCTNRGGSYNTSEYTAGRVDHRASSSYENIGFRVRMYVINSAS